MKKVALSKKTAEQESLLTVVWCEQVEQRIVAVNQA